MKRIAFLSAVVLGILALVPSFAVADSATHTFSLVIFAPNMGEAPNGDHVAITGGGAFSVNPKSVTASGSFIHTDSAGTVLGGGSWTATDLLDYQSYGCGEVFGTPLPPNFCGGKLKMRVSLTTPLGQLDGILTVFCVVGPNPPNSQDEDGVTLDVPGVINFNHAAGGGNVYVQLS
jgi:hypothetical protein